MTRGKAAGWLQARPAETHDALPHAGGCFRAGRTPRHLGISEPSKPLEMCFFSPRRHILLFLSHWGSANDAGCSLAGGNPQDEHHHAAITYTEGLTPTGSLTQRSLTSLLIQRPHQAWPRYDNHSHGFQHRPNPACPQSNAGRSDLGMSTFQTSLARSSRSLQTLFSFFLGHLQSER